MTTVTLRNAQDLPSPVTLYFEDRNLDLEFPHSPTSSLKGVFVRSRPSSMDFSDHDLPSDFSQFGMTSNTIVPLIQAPPASHGQFSSAAGAATPYATRDRDISFRDDRTVRTTASAATTPVRTVRRIVEDDDAQEDYPEEAMPRTTTTANWRRTWPSIQNLRGRVSGIFHRKHNQPTAPPPSPALSVASSTSTLEITHVVPTSQTRRTFSLSLRARPRHRTSSTSVSTRNKVPVAHTPVEHVVARARRVRRSRSFSGFTSMAHQVLAPIAEPDADADGMAELDEVGIEAYNTARGVGQFWVYEEDLEGAGDAAAVAGVLERGVERGW
ncbi:hypothetical protein C8F04DRAFT_1262604 [Mycena alexandri]|uniref:Uncharacterized protein n=1 Tax=Mycena alexandri TaxID=1745969 RepID=A0AAD6SPM4_9AGAR|nr:hypothetical protein C8F04DRAFT_1262604 [Mycena alexandri]